MNRTLLLLVFFALHVNASAQKKKSVDSVQVIIDLDNSRNGNLPVDSLLIIFDRYDLDGAGKVLKIFHPVNNRIIIDKLPRGKYYVDVFCMGIHSQYFTEISHFYKTKNILHYRLKKTDPYTPGTVFIPAEKIDPSKLLITSGKLR